MTTNDLLERVRAADPTRQPSEQHSSAAGCTSEAQLTSAAERTAVLEAILATPRPSPVALGSRAPLWRRLAIGAVAASVVTTAVVVGGVVTGPDHVGGPATASAAAVLGDAAEVARGSEDYRLSGSERVYSGVLVRVAEPGNPEGGALKRIASGEYWTDRDGNRLERVVAQTSAAKQQLGTGADGLGFFRTWAKDDTDLGSPWTYRAIRAVPTDPAGLARFVRDRALASAPTDARVEQGYRVEVLVSLLEEPLAPAALRGAAFDQLAAIDGASNLGPATDALGRNGIRISYPHANGASPDEPATLILDTVSTRLLETNTADSDVRTYVGPIVVSAERVVPQGVSLVAR